MTEDRARITILTIGHSTRSIEEFLDLLKQNDAQTVADVRSIPRSRHVPQFNLESLPTQLKTVNIGYVHMTGLGGLRRPKRNSINTAWRNASFRGFADYMQTPDFENSLRELIELAYASRVIVMCAESVPWRCHRSLIADALTVRGIQVKHIMGRGKIKAHSLTPWAQVSGTSVIYPQKL